MTIGGGYTQRPHGRAIVWPRDSRRRYVPPGQPLVDLLDRRPELADMIMPRVQELLKESA